MVQQIKIIVEKHSDGYVAYPLGLKGVVVAEGDTYEEALADAKSAIQFHVETFGKEVLKRKFITELFKTPSKCLSSSEMMKHFWLV